MASVKHAARSRRALAGLRAFFREDRVLGERGGAAQGAARAEAGVLRLFRDAARHVPAYRRFLATHAIDPESVDSIEAFRRVPVTTKDNYYRENPLPDLCRNAELDACDIVALSTGSTGEPAVWPRFVTDELGTAERIEQVLAGAFDARERRTLAVICFALGNWVGGIYTLACVRQLAAKGYAITAVSPGNSLPEILRALRALGPHYDQRILFGYPPFLKDVIEHGQREGVDWSTPATRLVMAGEVFSEEWRDRVCQRLGAPNPARATASLYGTADGGVLANETPLSIRIRRALALRPDAARTLFGESRLPTLCQYDPEHRFFEVEDGWLLFSGDGGAPLLRYKILDRGGIIGHAQMLRFLEEHQVVLERDPAGELPELPFVFVFGRSHFAVSFYGANVFPENVSSALEKRELAAEVSGKFVLEVVHDTALDSELRLIVELARGQSAAPDLAMRIGEAVRCELERQNSEFASYVPERRRTPRIELRPFGDPGDFPPGVKHRYTRH